MLRLVSRSILDLAVPAWQGALIVAQKLDIERVQKGALHIILGEQYENYTHALKLTNLEKLENRRVELCYRFAKKCEKNDKHKHWFVNKPSLFTRQKPQRYKTVIARTDRLKKSPICYLTELLNKHHQK